MRLVWMGPLYSPDEALAAAEDAADEAAAEVAEATEEVAQAAEEAPQNDQHLQAAETRLREAEARLSDLESQITELRDQVLSRAAAEHDHPMPGDMQTVADALAEMEAEEQAPKRARWYERPLFGRG